ncbi:MAG TPA: zf-HC2 domain-containing protein [Candidatus Baltobacteraceae bacterium]|jgi:anti-sigma factor RsiW|nr:zf-HC2 domain-containing protein [Candidatus Baltobacteraceae bacterium]
MMQHIDNETLIDYMHGALPPQADAAVYAHMETCAQCREQFEAEAALTEMLHSYAAATERDFPSTLKAEIWSRVRSAQPSFWSRVRDNLRPAVFVPVAAALALAAYFGSTLLSPHAPPSIEAAYYLQDHAALNTTVPFSDRNSSTPVDLQNGAMIAPSEETAVNVQPASYTADAGQ